MSIYMDMLVDIIKQRIDQDGHSTLMELAKHTGIFLCLQRSRLLLSEWHIF